MVDLTHCIYRDEYTELASSYIIKSRSTDSRTIVNYNELPEMTTKEFIVIADKLGSEASWYHFEACLFLSSNYYLALSLRISRGEL